MADHYHWTQLRSGLLPIEPESLATCVAWDGVCRAIRQETLVGVLQEMDLTPRELAPALVAGDMAEEELPGQNVY